MNSLTAEYLDSLAFTTTEINSLKLLKKYREKQAAFFQQVPGILQSLRITAENDACEYLSQIESVTNKTRLEQLNAGYRIVYHLIYESAEKLTFTADVILHLQKLLCRYMPNANQGWRTTEITNSHVLFMPPQAASIVNTFQLLTKHYASAVAKQKQDALVLIPLVILDILCMQPFGECNQTIARLLTLMMLYQFDYQVGFYVSLDRLFNETKDQYAKAFASSANYWCSSAHDAKPWLHYFWEILLRAYNEFEEKVGVIVNSRGSKTELIRSAIKRRPKAFTITDIETDCPGISHDMIRRVLRQMRDKGLISVSSNGRGAKWRKVAKDKAF